ncbi:hypothetical protein SAMN05216520_10670 [Kandleria vitulina]|uniref:hypothetical protein n=1 Tax=Kandleria vitulina TaxID=1630 RepID=UPI0008854F35|nr:hypothetical protein [Kandleria vitulina]SDL47259.1 hypothetical protein SAMN05216520_10670 [Kandleria vitulina]
MKKDEKKITIILVIITVLFSLYRVYSTLTPTNYADYKKRISLQVDADFNYEPIDNIERSDTYVCRFTLKKPVELKNFISLDQFKQSKRKDIEKFYQSDYRIDIDETDLNDVVTGEDEEDTDDEAVTGEDEEDRDDEAVTEDNSVAPEHEKFFKEIKQLKASSSTKYVHRRIKNIFSYELYIYNKELNIGYYIANIE